MQKLTLIPLAMACLIIGQNCTGGFKSSSPYIAVQSSDSSAPPVTVPVTAPVLPVVAGQLSPTVMSLGALAPLNGFVPSPTDLWHQDISALSVDPNSASIMSNIGASHLHHDFSSPAGGNYGIPYTIVDSSTTPLIEWTDVGGLGDTNSDQTLYPLPPNLLLEGSPPACGGNTGDNHAIVIDRRTGVGYEMWRAQYCPTSNPAYNAINGTIWDFKQNEQRPYTFTSADAAGLSVFEGLLRYDEIVAGEILHAIRFTTTLTKCADYKNGDGYGSFYPPATHSACNNSGTNNVYGMKLRLKASFDISGYSKTNQIILTAMKKHGLMLADLGSSLFFQGTPDPRWNDNDLEALDSIQSSAFEVVQMPAPPMISDNYPSGLAPIITSFTASSTSIAAGQPVTLTALTSGASYNYIDKAGFLLGNSITVSPTVTTTYTLTSTNFFLVNDDGYGDGSRPTASVTVTVH